MPGREAWAVHSPRAHSLGDSPRAHSPGTHSPGTHRPGTHSRGTQPPSHSVASGEAVPSYSGAAGEAASVPAAPVLSRRVPQANLAPELRRRGQEQGQVAGGDPSLPDAAEARAALSRYQASRQAARAMVEEGADPERPASGGWS